MKNTDVLHLFEKHVDNIKSSGTNQWVGNCPFPNHPDRKASFCFNSEHGLYNCKGCGEEGNAIKFAKAMGENPEPFYSDDYQATKVIGGKTYYHALKETKKEVKVDKLLKIMNDKFVKQLPKELDNSIHSVNGVGMDDGCLTYPYFDADGNVDGIKRHKPKAKSWGNMKKRWYGIWHIEHASRETLIITEGEKDVCTLKEARFGAVVSGRGGSNTVPPIPPVFKEFKEIIILYDNDEAGRKGAVKMADTIYKSLGVLPHIAEWWYGLPKGFDCSDDYKQNPKLKETYSAIGNAKRYDPMKSDIPSFNETDITKGYTVISVADALELDIPKPPMIVEDILNERGNTLLTAEDGVGKSMMANQLGCSIAIGEDFLGYKVPKPYKVLLVQHEMENGEQVDRLKKQTVSFFKKSPELFKENLQMQLIQESDNLAITDQFDVLDRTFYSHPEIQVCVFDNIGMSTNVEMTKPDAIRNELKRLKGLCRKHNVAFLLVAHHVKVDWLKDMDLLKKQIQGGKPVTDWADNVIQLHTSSLNTDLVLMKVNKVRSIHNDEGISSRGLPQAVWFNKDNNLLFTGRFTVTNWIMHFKALDKFEQETEFIKKLAEYPQPFDRNIALNVGTTLGTEISPATTDRWLKKLVKPMGWLIKVEYGKYRINQEVLDYIQVSEE